MVRRIKSRSITVVDINNRYPNIKKEFPNARFLDPVSGKKFIDKKAVIEDYKRQAEYYRLVNKPTLRVKII